MFFKKFVCPDTYTKISSKVDIPYIMILKHHVKTISFGFIEIRCISTMDNLIT